MLRRRQLLISLLSAAVAVGLVTGSALLGDAAAVPSAPSPGAAGLGDRLNPGIGNGGYDVHHYDLDLRYATSDPAQPIDGEVTILARADAVPLAASTSTSPGRVGGISVDGGPAVFTREGRGARHDAPELAAAGERSP